MSETYRVYTPPPVGSFDPLTIGITGGIPLFFDTRTRGGGDPTNVIRAVVTTTAGDYAGGGGDFRLPPFSFVPNPPGVRTMAGGPQGGIYVANPDGPPARPGTGNFMQDLANAYNTPGFASSALSLLTGPAAIPSIMAGTALSSLSSDPRVTGLVGGLGDLLADAMRTPEERAMRSEAAKGFEKEAQRAAETRMGITVEDLPTLSLSELSNIAAVVDPEAPATISVPGPEADIGVFGEENDTTTGTPGQPGAPAAPSTPAAPAAAPAAPSGALTSLETHFENLMAALDRLAAEEQALVETGRVMMDIANLAATLSNDKGLSGDFDGSVPSPDKSEPGIGGEKGEAPGAPNDGGGPGGPSGAPGGSTDSVADSPGAGGGVGADGSVGPGGDAWKKGGLVKFAEGGLAELLDEDVSPRTAREYFRELIRADAQRNLQGLPEILANTGFDRNRGVNLVPYGARVRAQMPGMREDDMLDLSAGYQGATVSGRGFRQSRNLLQEAGAGYTFPDGGRLSLDYFDRMDGGEVESGIERDPDLRHQDVRAPSNAEMMGRPVPSRGVRLGYRREFAGGGLVPLAGGGKIAIGPGGGLDDLIPTSINGRRAAALSDGEFVIPADVVSMMGDGSSNAGARRLYDLVRQVRDAKTGTTKQAGPLPVGEILKRSMGR